MSIHWTTIAAFISGSSEEIDKIFREVLKYCNELNLIGGINVAGDGLRLPSNASIENSGTKEQLQKRLERLRKMAKKHVIAHGVSAGITERLGGARCSQARKASTRT